MLKFCSENCSFLVLITVLSGAAFGADEAPVVEFASGAVRGKLVAVPQGKFVHQFLGIPYAEPPVGERRFAAPDPIAPWHGVRDARNFGASCPQLAIPFPLNFTMEGPTGEDCLLLNLFVPAQMAPSQKLGVMVWIHGGGFTAGSGREYDGSVLAAFNDVIVVTLNYRLGLLGFFNMPETDIKGNYGMLDQVLALKWVQQNIGQFGGDQKRVTLFGESAGARSVLLHLLSPLTAGLFRRAIAQSGAPLRSLFWGHCNKVIHTAQLDHVVTLTQCDLHAGLLECLRSKSVDEIIGVQKEVSQDNHMTLTSPVVDGAFLPDEPKTLLDKGTVHPAEVLIGVTKDETSLVPSGHFNSHPVDGVPRELFEAVVQNTPFTQNDNELVKAVILHEYTNHSHPHSPTANLDSWINVLNDAMMLAPSVYTATALANTGGPIYFYVFAHQSEFSIYPDYVGVTHTSEIAYVFGSPFKFVQAFASTTKFSEKEADLSRKVMQLWTNFAKYGNPHGDQEVTAWPTFSPQDEAYLNIAIIPRVGYRFRASKMAFWNELIPKLAGYHLTKHVTKDGPHLQEKVKEEL